MASVGKKTFKSQSLNSLFRAPDAGSSTDSKASNDKSLSTSKPSSRFKTIKTISSASGTLKLVPSTIPIKAKSPTPGPNLTLSKGAGITENKANANTPTTGTETESVWKTDRSKLTPENRKNDSNNEGDIPEQQKGIKNELNKRATPTPPPISTTRNTNVTTDNRTPQLWDPKKSSQDVRNFATDFSVPQSNFKWDEDTEWSEQQIKLDVPEPSASSTATTRLRRQVDVANKASDADNRSAIHREENARKTSTEISTESNGKQLQQHHASSNITKEKLSSPTPRNKSPTLVPVPPSTESAWNTSLLSKVSLDKPVNSSSKIYANANVRSNAGTTSSKAPASSSSDDTAVKPESLNPQNEESSLGFARVGIRKQAVPSKPEGEKKLSCSDSNSRYPDESYISKPEIYNPDSGKFETINPRKYKHLMGGTQEKLNEPAAKHVSDTSRNSSFRLKGNNASSKAWHTNNSGNDEGLKSTTSSSEKSRKRDTKSVDTGISNYPGTSKEVATPIEGVKDQKAVSEAVTDYANQNKDSVFRSQGSSNSSNGSSINSRSFEGSGLDSKPIDWMPRSVDSPWNKDTNDLKKSQSLNTFSQKDMGLSSLASPLAGESPHRSSMHSGDSKNSTRGHSRFFPSRPPSGKMPATADENPSLSLYPRDSRSRSVNSTPIMEDAMKFGRGYVNGSNLGTFDHERGIYDFDSKFHPRPFAHSDAFINRSFDDEVFHRQKKDLSRDSLSSGKGDSGYVHSVNLALLNSPAGNNFSGNRGEHKPTLSSHQYDMEVKFGSLGLDAKESSFALHNTDIRFPDSSDGSRSVAPQSLKLDNLINSRPSNSPLLEGLGGLPMSIPPIVNSSFGSESTLAPFKSALFPDTQQPAGLEEDLLETTEMLLSSPFVDELMHTIDQSLNEDSKLRTRNSDIDNLLMAEANSIREKPEDLSVAINIPKSSQESELKVPVGTHEDGDENGKDTEEKGSNNDQSSRNVKDNSTIAINQAMSEAVSYPEGFASTFCKRERPGVGYMFVRELQPKLNSSGVEILLSFPGLEISEEDKQRNLSNSMNTSWKLTAIPGEFTHENTISVFFSFSNFEGRFGGLKISKNPRSSANHSSSNTKKTTSSVSSGSRDSSRFKVSTAK